MFKIPRDLYLNKLIANRHNTGVKVITGLKGCGKSFLLFTLFKEHLKRVGIDEDHIIEIAFDDPESGRFCDPQICRSYLEKRLSKPGMHYLLLDEVQHLQEFEAVLNGLLKMGNADVYVTGSRAKFLSKDIITEFRGRGDEVRMYPLSFSEFMSVYQGSAFEGLKEYLTYGGMPQVLGSQSEEDKALCLKSIFDKNILGAIKERHKIRCRAALEELITILSSAVGSYTSQGEIFCALNGTGPKSLSAPVLRKYLNSLDDAFLIDTARRYDVRGKRYAVTPFKCYFTDPGLRNLCLNFPNPQGGGILENVIFNELKLRGFEVDCGAAAQGGRWFEIDFVCNLGSKRYYIQFVTGGYDEQELTEKIRALKLTRDFFKKIVITMHTPFTHYNEDGILLMNIFDFLSDPLSLEF